MNKTYYEIIFHEKGEQRPVKAAYLFESVEDFIEAQRIRKPHIHKDDFYFISLGQGYNTYGLVDDNQKHFDGTEYSRYAQ